MISYIRYSLFPLIFFPLLFMALLSANNYGWYYVIGFTCLYILADNFLPSHEENLNQRFSWIYDLILLLHIPFSVIAMLLLFYHYNPSNSALAYFSQRMADLLPCIDKPQLSDSYGSLTGLVLAVGFMFGHNTAVAHELMHRRNRFLYESSRFLFGMCGDAQVVVSHIHSHHLKVATFDDPTSARRGETIYQFFIRAISGQYRDTWLFEKDRLEKKSTIRKVTGNQLVNGLLLSFFLLGIAFQLAGIWGLATYFLIMFIAKWLLESINYVQHYGLARVPGTRVNTWHSWESRGQGTATGLYNSLRHGGHHVNGTLPFWQLQVGSAPIHKYGYMVAILAAMLPFLWFKYVVSGLSYWDEKLSNPDEQIYLKKTSANLN